MRYDRARITALLTAASLSASLGAASACTSDSAQSASEVAAPASPTTPTTSRTTTTLAPTTEPAPTTPRPAWLGQRLLATDENGFGIPADTPPELIGRAFATVDTLPPPQTVDFQATIAPLAGDELARSTWTEGCPVPVADLAYLTVSFWGFDEHVHTGELIVHRDSADDIVTVFHSLFDAEYPLEEMRIITDADLAAHPTGDTNNTGSFVCRLVQGTGIYSQHAYGLAIDINPFHNPLVRDDLVLPELAGYYADRARRDEALIGPDSVVVRAFADIGWSWGGDWSSLKDYQHFSLTGQ